MNRAGIPTYYSDAVASYNEYEAKLKAGEITKAQFDAQVAGLNNSWPGFADIIKATTGQTALAPNSIARTVQSAGSPGAEALANRMSLGNVGVQPQAGGGDPASGSKGIRVQLKDGTTQIFPNIDESLNQALLGGGFVIGPGGKPAEMVHTPDGGWLANGQGLDKWLAQSQPGTRPDGQQAPAGTPASGTSTTGTPAAAPQKYPNAIKVRMADGSIQNFDSISPDLDKALQEHGVPIDPTDGSDMQVTSGVYGNGYLFNGLPINIVMGGEWAPGQKQATENYYSAGYQPGGKALENPPALPPDASGGAAGGSPFSFGYLTQTFDDQFKAPEGKPAPFDEKFQGQRFNEQFTPTTAEDVMGDPGIRFALEEAQKALERKGSAQQYLGTPRLGKEMTRFTEDYASTKFNDVNNRRLEDFGLKRDLANENYGKDLTEFQTRQGQNQTDVNNWNTDWDRAMREYAQKRDVFRGNRSDVYGYIAPIAGFGQSAATTTGNFAEGFGTQAGANITGAGNATAAGKVAAGNIKRDAYGNIIDDSIDIFTGRKRGLAAVGMQQ